MIARRILRLRTTPVAGILSGQRVRIDGKVVGSETGHLVAPCSGDMSVWFRVRLRSLLAGGGGGDGGGGVLWETILDEEDAAPFHIDDGSGQQAQIATTIFRVLATNRAFNKLDDAASERLRTFLARRGHESASADVYEEECIRLGDEVALLGWSRRRAGEVRREIYRDAPSSSLVVEGNPDEELIVATPEALRRATRGAYLASQTVMALGIVAIVAGMIVHRIVPE